MSNDAAAESQGIPEVSEDALLGGRVTLCQPVEGYRAAIDPVFLAAAVPAFEGQQVLDAGSGAGAASLCLARRVEGVRVTGIEIQPALATLAAVNIERNGLSGRVAVVEGDIVNPPPQLLAESFHHVMANPPYLEAARGDAPANAGKALANVEGAAEGGDSGADLAAWVRFGLEMLVPKGRFTVIHRADRLDALLSALYGKAGEVVVFPFWARAGRPARRVIVQARKGVHGPARISPGLVLHAEDGGYTPAAEAVLRGGEGLTL